MKYLFFLPFCCYPCVKWVHLTCWWKDLYCSLLRPLGEV